MLSRRLTKEEIIATIKHSSIPTVLVEGKDDIIFYRKLEEDEELCDLGLSMLPAGSKNAVLSIKKEIDLWPDNNMVAYIVDQDIWVNFGVPDDINGVVLTKGYSIENDLFEDGNLFSLLEKEELKTFYSEKERFIGWYALTLSRNIQSKSQGQNQNGKDKFCYKLHPGKVLDDNIFYTEQTRLYEKEEFPTHLYNDIKLNWCYKLRGKSLLALLMRQLTRPNRNTKHNERALMEFAACQKGSNYKRIVSELRKHFINKS